MIIMVIFLNFKHNKFQCNNINYLFLHVFCVQIIIYLLSSKIIDPWFHDFYDY